jgi:hypothetical protein
MFGFGQLYYYAPVILIFFIFKFNIINKISFDKNYIILTLLMILSLVPVYLLGVDRLTLDEPLLRGFILIGSLLLMGFSFQYQQQHVQYKMLLWMLFGKGIWALTITMYSYVQDPIIYGYGALLDPFNSIEMNSPAVSNALALFYVTLLYLVHNIKNNFKKKALTLMLIVIILCAIYLGGRTFFVIIFLAHAMFLISFRKLINKTKALFYLILATLLIWYLAINIDSLSVILETSMDRFEKKGVSSVRFDLLVYGLSTFWEYPFGGMMTALSDSGYGGVWFHNVFLDNARLGGYIPTFSLFFTVLFILTSVGIKRKTEYFRFYFLLFITVLLLMQQEVIIEGSSYLLVLFYLTGIAMLRPLQVQSEIPLNLK